MIIAQSPGRVGIIGNPTDGYGGSVISCSIQNKATVIIEPAEELTLTNRFGNKILRRAGDFAFQGDHYDIPRAVLNYFNLYELKAKINIDTSIKEQAGLAGSTALLSACLNAVIAFCGIKYHKYYLAELIRFLELRCLKCQCGYQDAYMTVFGGLNYLDFRGKEHDRELDEEPYATVEPLHNFIDELPFVIAVSGLKHHSGDFHRPLRERWLDGDRKVELAYREIAELARQGKKALLLQDWIQLARLMNANHEIQDGLASSGEQINNMIQVARKNGALAAKLAGAGGGGTIIVLTLNPVYTIKALKQAGIKEFIRLDPCSKGITVGFGNI